MFWVLTLPFALSAQTDMDAIMMEKGALCVGPMYSYSSWTQYWEGQLKRDNANLGRVSTRNYSVMGNYGITRKLNLLFNIPYIKTRASAGTLAGISGLQDLSLFLKWRPWDKRLGDGRFSVFTMAGFSLPLSDYTADYLPLAIGLESRTLMGRLMADYERNHLFATISATYIRRMNIKIDRSAYYTTRLHLTNEVEMPDATNYQLRLGYRSRQLIAEALLNQWNTLGGFDITRNNMPFPSNRMNATMLGLNIKYVMPFEPRLALVAGGNTTIAGRNVGQANQVYGSLFYVFDFSSLKKK